MCRQLRYCSGKRAAPNVRYRGPQRSVEALERPRPSLAVFREKGQQTAVLAF